MMRRPVEAGRPRAGRSMTRIHGRAKNLIHSADTQIAALAAPARAAVAEGHARTSLYLCRKGPCRGVGVRDEVVDARLRRVGLSRCGALDGDIGGSDPTADIGREALIRRVEADNHIRQQHRGAGRESVAEGVFIKPNCGVRQCRAMLVACQLETFELQSWLPMQPRVHLSEVRLAAPVSPASTRRAVRIWSAAAL